MCIPPQVRDELCDTRTPDEVRAYIASPPAWLAIKPPARVERIPPLDPGEEAAIALTRELSADALLIDDRDGRRAATRLGIAVIGTLGVLERAAEGDLLEMAVMVDRLARTDFRLSPRLVQEAVDRDRQRRASRHRGDGPRAA